MTLTRESVGKADDESVREVSHLCNVCKDEMGKNKVYH